MKTFLIVGAGISGCAAGLELARGGHRVEVLESSDLIGGQALSYGCKATEDCSQCGVCLAHTVIHQALRHPGIRFITGAAIESVHGLDGSPDSAGGPGPAGEKPQAPNEAVSTPAPGVLRVRVRRRLPAVEPGKCTACDACRQACPAGAVERVARAELAQYRIDPARCLLHRGRDCAACRGACPAGAITAGEPRAGALEETVDLQADAALIATGHQPFDAARRFRLGHGRLPNVMSGLEAEQALARRSLLGEPGESLAFVQCVGSRDPRLGRNYCSAVCCAYALRLARVVRHRDPASRVTVYYIDLQHFDKTFTLLRRELEARGVRFVRGLPYSVERTAAGRLKLRLDGESAEHDRLVLSVGMGPGPGAEATAALFGLARDAHGFLGPAVQGRPGEEPGAPRPGAVRVHVTGTCREPLSIPESLASARAAALEMMGGEA